MSNLETLNPSDGFTHQVKGMVVFGKTIGITFRLVVAIGHSPLLVATQFFTILNSHNEYSPGSKDFVNPDLSVIGAPPKRVQWPPTSSWSCNSSTLTTVCEMHHVVYQRSAIGGHVMLNIPSNSSTLPPPPKAFRPVHDLETGTVFHAEVQFRRETRDVDSGDEAICDRYVDRDAYMFGVLNANNYGHVFFETIFPLFKSIMQFNPQALHSLLDGDAASGDKMGNAVLLICDISYAGGGGLWKHQAIMNAFSKIRIHSMSDLRSAGGRICFKRLIVGLSDRLSMYGGTHIASQRDKFQAIRFLRRALLGPISGLGLVDETQDRGFVSVGIVHRKECCSNMRKLYRPEYVRASVMSVRGDIEASLLDFDGMTMKQQAMTVDSLDILMGIVGTGMFNGAWLRRGSVGVQLFPFGCDGKGGTEFRSLIESAASNYISWTSNRVFGPSFKFANGTLCSAPQGCDPLHILPPLSHLPELALQDPASYWEQVNPKTLNPKS